MVEVLSGSIYQGLGGAVTEWKAGIPSQQVARPSQLWCTLTFVAFQCEKSLEKHSKGGNRPSGATSRRTQVRPWTVPWPSLGNQPWDDLWWHDGISHACHVNVHASLVNLHICLGDFSWGALVSALSAIFCQVSPSLCELFGRQIVSGSGWVGVLGMRAVFGWLSFKPRLYRKCGQNGLISPPCTLPSPPLCCSRPETDGALPDTTA